MDRLLNRGLNFSILPDKIDITQLLVDCKKYERAVIWTEYWHGKENIELKEQPIFKTNKSNLPKNYRVPDDLKVFLNSIRSEISDPRNRIDEECNLPPDEKAALKDLAKLQKDKKIVIKSCDKGAGILILDYSEYMKACYKHLSSTNPEQSPYYSQVDGLEVERTKTKIETILKDAIQNSIKTKDEYEGMIANDKEPGRFYCNFKIHKQHETNKAPPERPIISGSGSITEGIGEYVNFHIKEIGSKHDSYIQDTPDFLRIIKNINEGPTHCSTQKV